MQDLLTVWSLQVGHGLHTIEERQFAFGPEPRLGGPQEALPFGDIIGGLGAEQRRAAHARGLLEHWIAGVGIRKVVMGSEPE